MKITYKHNKIPFTGLVRNFLGKRRPILLFASGLAGMLLVLALLFSIFRYGVYLKEAGHTTYFNNTLQKVAQLDFSFIGNYSKGQMAELDEFALDIKFKHLLRLQYLRKRSLEVGLILPEFKNEEFPAKLSYKGATHDVKIALTGLVAKSHLRNPTKWSFELKVKGDDTVLGMKRFALLLPDTRGYLTDWLGFELMKEMGMMGFRVDFVNISINGKDAGVFYLEERFDKHLIENNRLREGIIFKIDEGLLPYREDKLMEDPATKSQVLLIHRLWQDVMAGDLPLHKFFDMKKMAQAFLICDLMNNKHPLAAQNMRYYFNPVTGLAEPILREWEELDNNNQSTISSFLEKPLPGTRHYRFEQMPFLRLVYDNLEFKRHYIREAAKACQVQFMDQFLLSRKNELDKLVSRIYRAWPFYEPPYHILYENQQHIRSALFPGGEQINARFDKVEGNRLRIHLENLQDFPLEAAWLSWRDSIRFYPEEPAVLDSRVKTPKEQALLFHFRIPEGLSWDEKLSGELKVHYNLLGLEPGEKTAPVRHWGYDHRIDLAGSPEVKPANYASFPFIVEEAGGEVIRIPAGNWTIARPLLIPARKSLEIAAGAKIDLVNQASITSYSPVFCRGTEDLPVQISSSDGTGRGLAVIEAREGSVLSHTIFENLSGPEEAGGLLPGAVTFYRSAVQINSCAFSNNIQGRDFLSIVRSDFTINNALFSNICANAFNSSLSTGSILNSSFANISGKGIDVSGTALYLSHILLNAIGEEGISARDGSELEANWAEIRNAAIGISGKDGARLSISNARIANSKVGVALYQEKQTFGPVTATASGLEALKSPTPYLVEKHSSFTLNGSIIPAKGENIKNILSREAVRSSMFN